MIRSPDNIFHPHDKHLNKWRHKYLAEILGVGIASIRGWQRTGIPPQYYVPFEMLAARDQIGGISAKRLWVEAREHNGLSTYSEWKDQPPYNDLSYTFDEDAILY